MPREKFSVSMCVYAGDNPEHFDVAISSIINQTVTPTEIVLTVDGPIPLETELVIDKYLKESAIKKIKFKVIRLEKNMGHGEARRVCFDNCSCELIALMDADDLSVPDRFEKQLHFFSRNQQVSVVGGMITEFFSSSNPIDTSQIAGKRIVPENDSEIKQFMKKRCPMNQVTVMFKKKDVAEVGGYLDWYCEEDYYLWIRLALAGKKFGNIPETLVNVRVGRDMYRRRGGLRYFQSEKKLQKYMFNNKVINFPQYSFNILKRLIIQVLMPNCMRGVIFRLLARKRVFDSR